MNSEKKLLFIKAAKIAQDLSLRNTSFELYNELGIILIELGDISGAENLFNLAIKYSSDCPAPHLNLASLLIDQDRFEEAKNHIDNSLILNNKYAEAYYLIALINRKKLILDHIETNLIKSLELNPSLQAAWIELAEYYSSICLIEKAIYCYQKALNNVKNTKLIQNNLGNLYKSIGRYAESLDCYNYSLEIDSFFPIALNNRANLLSELGRVDEAIQDYKKSISASPNFVEAYNNLGSLLIQIKKYQESLIFLNQAINIQTNFPLANYNLGRAYLMLNENDKAKIFFDKALKNKPDLLLYIEENGFKI